MRTRAQTGVEMEALTAVAVAALTIYDMVKAVDRAMVIGDIRLEYKSGGRSGTYERASSGGAATKAIVRRQRRKHESRRARKRDDACKPRLRGAAPISRSIIAIVRSTIAFVAVVASILYLQDRSAFPIGYGEVGRMGAGAGRWTLPVYGYTVVNSYPHDRDAYTQGLQYHRRHPVRGNGAERPIVHTQGKA